MIILLQKIPKTFIIFTNVNRTAKVLHTMII